MNAGSWNRIGRASTGGISHGHYFSFGSELHWVALRDEDYWIKVYRNVI